MLFGIDAEEYLDPIEAINRKNETIDVATEKELRRQMYERIARGHALSEAEEIAHEKWRRK